MPMNVLTGDGFHWRYPATQKMLRLFDRRHKAKGRSFSDDFDWKIVQKHIVPCFWE
jgi:hypothetical protein